MIAVSGICSQRQQSSARLAKPYTAKMPSMIVKPRPFPNFQTKKITAASNVMIAVVANAAFVFLMVLISFM